MPESCPDMAVDGDELGVHYTVITVFFILYIGIFIYQWKEVRFIFG